MVSIPASGNSLQVYFRACIISLVPVTKIEFLKGSRVFILHGEYMKDGIDNTRQGLKSFIEKVFSEVVESRTASEAVISQYFSPHYIQHVDGTVMTYHDFVQHMITQKALLTSVRVFIERCVVEGNRICTIHIVHAVKNNGQKVAVKVIACFEIENGKIVLCDELTHLLNGDEEDVCLGSVK